MINLCICQMSIMNVLLIGDSQQEEDLFKLALTRINTNAAYFSAPSCDKAISGLQYHEFPPPDFIFLDTDIPDLNVRACLRTLKNSDALMLPAVILYTSNRLQYDIEEMRDDGATSVLFKSRSFQDFCHDLDRLFAKEKVLKTS